MRGRGASLSETSTLQSSVLFSHMHAPGTDATVPKHGTILAVIAIDKLFLVQLAFFLRLGGSISRIAEISAALRRRGRWSSFCIGFDSSRQESLPRDKTS